MYICRAQKKTRNFKLVCGKEYKTNKKHPAKRRSAFVTFDRENI